jgi:cbb3-type cytochrome oxidase subunit 3
MTEWLFTLFLQSWLVIAVLLFIAIIVLSFSPGARSRMDRHARIPFMIEDERDGEA